MKKRLLVVGLDQPEIDELRERITGPILFHEGLPAYELVAGELRARGRDRPFLQRVDAVIFHGIFEVERDFDFLTALALWRGPCYPNALGLLDCRLRLPCLARALRVTHFGDAARGLVTGGTEVKVTQQTVAKWSNWHCGENKARFGERWQAEETSLLEPFIDGEAVRVALIGEQAWQVRLAGNDWLQSIHHPDAALMPLDPELHEDARRLQAHFGLEMLAIDYMCAKDGQKHLLEVNHVPNVTVFPTMRQTFLNEACRWVTQLQDT